MTQKKKMYKNLNRYQSNILPFKNNILDVYHDIKFNLNDIDILDNVRVYYLKLKLKYIFNDYLKKL